MDFRAKKGTGILEWIKYKGWFLFDLPFFIKEKKFNAGIELGAKAGRSMCQMLRVNKELKLIGVDLWEVIDGGAYKDNNKNEWRCRRKLKKYGDRFILLKGDAFKIAKEVKDQSFDFVFYDLQCKPMQNFHRDMIEVWLPKLKKGGYLIGRDFRAFRNDFYALGFKEEDFQPCTIGDRKSTRLEYLVIP